MALLQINFNSQAVGVNLPLNVILPEKQAPRSAKLLYLLHGLSDDASAWQRFTNVEILANELNFVIIMPSAGRSFYNDMPNGQAYFSYLTEELPAWLMSVFQLDHTRANTAIAGHSMGGFGAFKAAFLRPDLYSAACSLSGALGIAQTAASPQQFGLEPKFIIELTQVFGPLNTLPGSTNDALAWLQNSCPENTPALWAACGLSDELLASNRQFVQFAQRAGFPIHYQEAAGGHDWKFWQAQIARFMHTLRFSG